MTRCCFYAEYETCRRCVDFNIFIVYFITSHLLYTINIQLTFYLSYRHSYIEKRVFIECDTYPV